MNFEINKAVCGFSKRYLGLNYFKWLNHSVKNQKGTKYVNILMYDSTLLWQGTDQILYRSKLLFYKILLCST